MENLKKEMNWLVCQLKLTNICKPVLLVMKYTAMTPPRFLRQNLSLKTHCVFEHKALSCVEKIYSIQFVKCSSKQATVLDDPTGIANKGFIHPVIYLYNLRNYQFIHSVLYKTLNLEMFRYLSSVFWCTRLLSNW